MIFKLSYNNQTHLYNKTLSLVSLVSHCSKVFKDLPQFFTFIYMSPKGEMTYIQTDADLIGLKYVCSLSNDMIVKLTILRSSRLEQFTINEEIDTLNMVKQNIQEMAQSIFDKLEDESHAEAASDYLSETYERISSEMIDAQNKIIKSEVKEYLLHLYERVITKSAQSEYSFVVEKPKTRKIVRFSPEKPLVQKAEEKSLDEIVNQRVLELIPSLVDKIYAKLGSKVNNKCKNCLKKQIQIEEAIETQINRKLSEASFDSLNPEE